MTKSCIETLSNTVVILMSITNIYCICGNIYLGYRPSLQYDHTIVYHVLQM